MSYRGSSKSSKYPIRHGKNPKMWAGDVQKRFCRKHFNEYNDSGWLSKKDTIEIVPKSECESIYHKSEKK